MSADELNVDGEECVYEAVIQWIQHDIEERHKHFTSLFQQVRLVLLAKEYINSQVLTNPLVARDPFCRGLISISDVYR